ncbi:MAG: molybdopterin-binding protein [Candidatus Bathyarchaeota archaeon]|nr:molybdopterin-binding protein [Candidatus Bathyarchaeota archaeon]
MKFSVEIIAIGDELCYGRVQDTNSFWIADQITKLGGEVRRITCIKDGLDEIHNIFKEALERKPKLIISTGGLGPTSDDYTIDALAKLSNKKAIINKDALTSISEKRGIDLDEIPEHFIKMSRSIDGANCILNPIGVAPTTSLKINKTVIIVMPGPPKEVQSIFKDRLLAIIQKETSSRSLSNRMIVNMRESEVSPIVEYIMEVENGVYLKPLVGESNPEVGLPIEIIVFDKDLVKCKVKMNKVIQILKDLVTEKGRKIRRQVN